MTDNELRIELLEREVAALRSVLSEWESSDKTEFIQWHKAQAIRTLFNCLKYGESK